MSGLPPRDTNGATAVPTRQPAARPEDLSKTRQWAIWAAWASLVAQMGIVVTGALVRLTGSGLGCPTWPECMPGSYTPVPHPATREHAWIEFGNRLLTFVVAATAVAALITGWRYLRQAEQRRQWRLRLLAASSLIGTVAQAVVGGLTVLTGLSPWWVSAHFLVSTAVIALAQHYVVVLQRHDPMTPSWLPGTAHIRMLASSAAVVTVLGVVVTGSGPHAGDVDVVARLPIHPLLATVLHSSAAWMLIVLAFLGLRQARANQAAFMTTLYTRLLVLLVLQGALGYTQSQLGLPIALVAGHVTGAVLIWAGVIRIVATARVRSAAIADV